MLIHLLVISGVVQYEGRSFGVVTGIFATVFSVVGFEILSLGLHTKTYSWSRRFDRDNPALRRFYKKFTLETGLMVGVGMALVGSLILTILVVRWLSADLQPLPNPEWASFGATLMILGASTVFSSLFISAMSMQKLEPYDQRGEIE
jgi:uncharacterized BrkB/YihY/UPF0761 family membrane protein